jgi:hypothetical protein
MPAADPHGGAPGRGVLLGAVPAGPAPVRPCRGPGGSRRRRPAATAGLRRPAYPGKAWLYRGHPDYAGEVDHPALIRRLSTYDGWALSTSAAALPAVLALCPPGVRVAAWHRGARPAASWRPLNGWEPVIYHVGRPVDPSTLQTRRVDSLVHGVSAMTTREVPGRGGQLPVDLRWWTGVGPE